MSVYDQFVALRKNQFRHSANKQLLGANAKRPKPTPGASPEMNDVQVAQNRDLKKMAAQEYGKNMNELTGAYGDFMDGKTENQSASGGSSRSPQVKTPKS